jgi:hypothetical protein
VLLLVVLRSVDSIRGLKKVDCDLDDDAALLVFFFVDDAPPPLLLNLGERRSEGDA